MVRTKTNATKPVHKGRHIVPFESLGAKQVVCAECNARLCRLSDLQRHIRGKHLQVRYQCSMCIRSYSQKSGLDNHFRKHTGEMLNCKYTIEKENGEIAPCPFVTDQDSSMTRHRNKEHGNVPRGPKQRGGPKFSIDEIPEEVLAGRRGAGGEYIPPRPGLPFGAYRRCAPIQQASLVDTPRVAGPSFTANTNTPSPPQSPSSGSMSPYQGSVLSFSPVPGTPHTAATTPETNHCSLPSPSPPPPPSMWGHQSLFAVSAIRQPPPTGNVGLPAVVCDNGRQATSRPQEDFSCTLPPLLPRSERQEGAVQLPPFSSLLRHAHAGSSTWPEPQVPMLLSPIGSMPTPTPTLFGVGVPITRTPSVLASFSPRHTTTHVNSSQATVSCAFATGNYAPQLASHFQSASESPSYRRLRPATFWPTDSRASQQGGAAGSA